MIPGFRQTTDQPDPADDMDDLSLADLARLTIDRYLFGDVDLTDKAQRVRLPHDPDRDDRARHQAVHRAIHQTRYRIGRELAHDRAAMIRDVDDWHCEWIMGTKPFRMTFSREVDDGGYPFPDHDD